MKRGIFLSLLSLFFLISCSNDDAPSAPASVVNAKVNGANMSFTNITVTEFPYQDNGQNYVDVTVVAELATDASKMIRFNLDQGLVGVNEMLVMNYEESGKVFDYRFDQEASDTAVLVSEITENTSSTLKGTFSGSVTFYNTTTMSYESVSLTEANYTIYY